MNRLKIAEWFYENQICSSVFKMSHPGYHHCQVICFAIFNGVFVTNGTTGLNKRCDTCFMPHLHTIIERKKCITSHDSPLQIKIELPCFFNCLPQGIYAAGLPATFSNELLILYQGNGVTF